MAAVGSRGDRIEGRTEGETVTPGEWSVKMVASPDYYRHV